MEMDLSPDPRPEGLTVIAEGTNPVFDLILIHGFGGHPKYTWCAGDVFWPFLFLPPKFPRCRILTYGYATDLSTNSMSNYASDLLNSIENEISDREENIRPIVFLCHSLGGLIVKKALILSRLMANEQALIAARIRGVIFLGTPHRGSDPSIWKKMVTYIGAAFSNELSRALKSGSEVLRDQLEAFPHVIQMYQIFVECFYESRGLENLPKRVVEEISACLQIGERTHSINANHTGICQFANEADSGFVAIAASIRRLYKSLINKEIAATTLVSINKHYTVPHSSSNSFTGRYTVLEQIGDCFFQQISRGRRPVYALYGLGGSGKTQIALKFAEDHRDCYWGIFWVDASNETTTEESYRAIARTINMEPASGHNPKPTIEESLNSVKQWLATAGKKWLLIVDNADDPDFNIAKLFPAGNRGHILITSRNPDSQNHAIGKNHQRIETMPEVEAVELLLRASHLDTSEEENRKEAGLIVKELGYLALAIDQAGAYIRNQGEIFEYLGRYKQHRKSLLEKRSVQGSSAYELPVYGTWEVSFSTVAKRNPVSADILQIFAFFHHEMISEEIFEYAGLRLREYIDKKGITAQGSPGLSNENNSGSEAPARLLVLLGQYKDDSWDNFLFRDAIETLLSFSLIGYSTDKTQQVTPRIPALSTVRKYSIHPLVHSWVHDRMQDEQPFRGLAINLLSASVSSRRPDQRFRRQIVPHMKASRLSFTDLHDLKWPMNGVIEISQDLAQSYYYAGIWKEDEALRTQALDMLKQSLGERHPTTLSTMHHIAVIYLKQGRWKEAEAMQVRVLDMNKEVLGEAHPDTLTTMHNLALTYSSQGRWKEAESMQVRVLDMSKEVLGEAHPHTLATMHNLASTYLKQGRWKEAEAMQVRVLDMRKEVLGEAHPDTLATMHSLAFTYLKQGRLKEAEAIQVRVIDMRKEVLGEAHPDTLTAIHNLASTYSNQGRWKEAEAMQVRVLDMRKEVIGEAHPHTLLTMHCLAYTYSNLSKDFSLNSLRRTPQTTDGGIWSGSYTYHQYRKAY